VGSIQVAVKIQGKRQRTYWRSPEEAEDAFAQGFATKSQGGAYLYRVFPVLNAEGQALRTTDWREGRTLVRDGHARIVKTKRGPMLAVGQVKPNVRTAVSREHISHETRNNPPRVYAHRWKPGLDHQVCG